MCSGIPDCVCCSMHAGENDAAAPVICCDIKGWRRSVTEMEEAKKDPSLFWQLCKEKKCLEVHPPRISTQQTYIFLALLPCFQSRTLLLYRSLSVSVGSRRQGWMVIPAAEVHGRTSKTSSCHVSFLPIFPALNY